VAQRPSTSVVPRAVSDMLMLHRIRPGSSVPRAKLPAPCQSPPSEARSSRGFDPGDRARDKGGQQQRKRESGGSDHFRLQRTRPGNSKIEDSIANISASATNIPKVATEGIDDKSTTEKPPSNKSVVVMIGGAEWSSA